MREKERERERERERGDLSLSFKFVNFYWKTWLITLCILIHNQTMKSEIHHTWCFHPSLMLMLNARKIPIPHSLLITKITICAYFKRIYSFFPLEIWEHVRWNNENKCSDRKRGSATSQPLRITDQPSDQQPIDRRTDLAIGNLHFQNSTLAHTGSRGREKYFIR